MGRTPTRSPTRIADVLADVLARLPVTRSIDDYRIWLAWDEVVGPTVARNAQPTRLDQRRLVVAVRNTAWMQELSMMRHELCARLNEWMGREVIAEIFLVVGNVEAASAAAPKPPKTTGDGDAAPRPDSVRAALDRLWQTIRAAARKP